jgi:hypothetical protein
MHDTNPHSPLKKVAPPRQRPAVGRVLQTKIPQKRGIILVFVVVLLTLLAVMGTAYLATSRADRQSITGRGAGPNGSVRPLLQDPSILERQLGAVESRIKQMLVQDLYDVTQATVDNGTAIYYPTAFRRASAPGANRNPNMTSFATQMWLSSTLPEIPDPTAPVSATNRPFWRFVSGGLDGPASSLMLKIPADATEPFTRGAFDPRLAGQSNLINLFDIRQMREQNRPVAVAMPKNIPQQPRARVYPGLLVPTGSPVASLPLRPPGNTFIGADADGDGISDSFLFPIPLRAPVNVADLQAIDRFVDTANGVIYAYGLRVVDNSSQINVNTALSAARDFALSLPSSVPSAGFTSTTVAAPTTGAAEESTYRRFVTANAAVATGGLPNLGFSRANVGLVELTDPMANFYSGAARLNEADRLFNARITGFSATTHRFNAFPTLTETGATARTTSAAAIQDAPSYVLNAANGFTFDFRYRALNASETVRGTASTPNDATVQFRGLGDYLELSSFDRSDRLPWGFLTAVPAANRVAITPMTLGGRPQEFDEASAAALAYRAGFIPLNSSITTVESTLADMVRNSAPNFTVSTSNAWGYFPPAEVLNWFFWTKELSNPFVTGATPAITNSFPAGVAPTGNATFDTSDGGSVAGIRPMMRPIRPLLTGWSGVTSLTPVRGDFNTGTGVFTQPGQDALGNGNATSMPPYRAALTTIGREGWFPPTRPSAAISSFPALWRAYWSAMSQNGITPPLGGPIPPSIPWVADGTTAGQTFETARNNLIMRNTGTTPPELTARQAVTLRAAVAAANTIAMRSRDFRDPGNATLFPTGDLTYLRRDVPSFRVALDGGLFARVFGTVPHVYISKVVVIPPGTGPSPSPAFYAIELFNPYDKPIDITSYSLTGVTRATTGVIGHPAAATYRFPSATPPVPAKGYLVLTNAAPPTGITIAPSSTTVVNLPPDPVLNAIFAGPEILLSRTRRGDGVSYTARTISAAEPLRHNILNLTEASATVDNSALTQVPVDLVDTRPCTFVTGEDGFRYIYVRTTGSTNTDAFKVVYAGLQAGPTVPGTAWTYSATGAIALGTAAGGTGGLATTPPINMFLDVLRTSLPINVMPFGTPFARDMDVMNVPFFGSYIIENAAGEPIEVNPLPMDLYTVEPNAATIPAAAQASIGRFDPTQPATAWAGDLLDYISARQSTYDRRLPDVPPQTFGDIGTQWNFDDDVPTGDGPARGSEATANPQVIRLIGNGPSTSSGAPANSPSITPNPLDLRNDAYSTLIEGRVNLNTAERAVYRLLPLEVDLTGRSGPDVVTDAMAGTVLEMVRPLRFTTSPTPAVPLQNLFDFNQTLLTSGGRTWPAPPAASARFVDGDITPMGAGLDDYKVPLLDATRLSNVASTRSDTFTVYLTVQAWSYEAGAGQAANTRLVGERRVSFIVDRSALDNFSVDTTKLKIIPVERE